MKFGFIGAGNMGGAIIGGMVKNYNSSDILVYDKNEESLKILADNFNICKKQSVVEVCDVDYLFLCVKPNVLFDVIDMIKDVVTDKTVVVSIVAGKSLDDIKNAFSKKLSIVRVMPNTPALVGEAMSAVCVNKDVDDEALKTVLDIFSSLGKAECVDEHLIDAVTGISGSSPAYVFMFIEALADAAVQGGMSRKMAYTFAAQAVLGSAKMVLETGMHPGELKDMVCSPSGTTIEAVAALEKAGFRNAVIGAVKACIEKSKNM